MAKGKLYLATLCDGLAAGYEDTLDIRDFRYQTGITFMWFVACGKHVKDPRDPFFPLKPASSGGRAKTALD